RPMSEPEKSEGDGEAPEKAPIAADAPSEPSAPASSEAPGESSVTSETDAAVTPDAPPKKKKKKKKRAADDAPKRDERDAEGRDRPTFVLTFPSDPALD